MYKKIDGERLRHAMRAVPSPITVVTVAGEKEPRGITIGSFTSVSLDPPLISFNLNREAQMYPEMMNTSYFAVHLLGDDQSHLSNHFAVPDIGGWEQFEGMSYRLDESGIPIIDDVLAIFFCSKYAVYEAGDHSIIVGEVEHIDIVREGEPLIYHNRSYRTVGEELKSTLFVPVKRVSSDTP